ncbi:ABC transporter ATP-binding protein [Pseudomonas wayambapalatensis]|uniref:ABC transporter ATP-binding protein n=1 Tax=unclassified Pseudomonas TaxID=196821 RepID=UPI0016463C40|nr:ABC transporter ATP-binding protein [Pseudomonas sp. RW3S2]MBC3421426.1 ABC transporter ATP-binding protein [Pseudomonas sp. RW3S2]QXI45329.1 ABC transporter ATP-binding protein [Pseudomonas wayambapalatensis]
MSKVSINKLKKQFGDAVALEDFSLEIADGELVAFLGPSGCGKTTTLRMIAGFIEPTAGSIHIGETDVTNLPVHKRNTGMVFQRYALFPHMTVAQNVSFGLEMHNVSGKERDSRIATALDMVRMTSFRDRYPRQLSGGQQQRVAIARALAIQPKVFLLDEPLSNLDAKLRVEVREEIRSLQQNLGLTTVFVTHDQEEALAISDRMAIMYNGRVQQIGSPKELYDSPSNHFVADFLGRMSFFKGNLVANGRFVSEAGTNIQVASGQKVGRIGIRPERINVGAHPESDNVFDGWVESAAYLGSLIDIRLRLQGGDILNLHVPNNASSANTAIAPGSPLVASFRSSDCVLFAE